MTKNHVRLFAGLAAILLACAYGYHEMTKPVFGCLLKRRPPLAMATSLESATNNFFIEYGKLPSLSTELRTNTPEGIQMLTVLLGLEKSDTPLNLRDIKFLAVKEGTNKRGGIICNASGTPEGLFDPWGSPYTVELDTDNDEVLRFTIGGKPVELKGRRVAAYSPGADGKPGTSDDVTTW